MTTLMPSDSCTIYGSVCDVADRFAAGKPQENETVAVNAKATILIVDDEPDVREVLEE